MSGAHRRAALFSLLCVFLSTGCATKKWQVTAKDPEMAPASQPVFQPEGKASSAAGTESGIGVNVRSGVGERFLEFPKPDDAVIARVGSEELKRSQVLEYMRTAFPQHVNASIQVMLLNRVLAAQCAEYGIEVPLSEVVEWYRSRRQKYESDAVLTYGKGTTLADYVKRTTGQTLTEFETSECERERGSRMMQRLVRYLEIVEERVEIRLISTADRPSAERLASELSAGADFAALAKAHSLHSTAERGGLMFPVWRGALNPLLEEPVFRTEEGKIGPIVRVEDDGGATRFQIFKIVKRYAPRAVGYRSVEDEIKRGLAERPFQPDEMLIWQLRANRIIKVDLNGLR